MLSRFLTFMSSSFSIQAVAERTGLTAHVIRAWERRYQAIEPERSPGKHRLYSEAEIERLGMLRRAVESGHSIGQIARLPMNELSALVPKQPATIDASLRQDESDPAASLRADALEAIAHFDAPGLETSQRNALLALGHNGLLRLVIAPLAEEIGERWRNGQLTAAHEHFFTASVKVFLGDLTRQFATTLTAPRMIVGTPSGQLHELGAIMAAATAANLGWRPVYLGPSLPAHEIAGAAVRNQATAVALSIVYPEDDPSLAHELTELSRLLPASTRIMVGGRAARAYFETLVRIGALYADSIEEFGNQLDMLRRGHAEPGTH
jgi:DNA-binding transcriptional MerR regulator/methylmalonyl-CoA mutase cobalamin-binding subunit